MMDIGWRAKAMEEVAAKELEWVSEKAALVAALQAALKVIEAYEENEGYLPRAAQESYNLLIQLGYVKG